VKDSKNKRLKMKGLFATHSPFCSTNSIIVSEFLHKSEMAWAFYALAPRNIAVCKDPPELVVPLIV
jgi:hypothetical protein